MYEFEASRDWVKKVAPYANFVAGVLKTVVPMVAPAVNVYFGAETIDQWGIKNHLDLMKEATDKLLPEEFEVAEPAHRRYGMLTEPERSGVLALHAFLREEDPNHERLGLKRVATYTGEYRWLCQKHYEDFQPRIPEKIE